MFKYKFIFLYSLISLIISSCATSNQVSNNRIIQKRKFNKGFHINNSASKTINTEKFNSKQKGNNPNSHFENLNKIETSVSITTDNFDLSKKAFSIPDKSTAETIKSNSNEINRLMVNSSQIEQETVLNFKTKNKVKSSDFRNKSFEKSYKKSSQMSMSEILTLVVIIVLIILAFTLLNTLTGGWLGYLVGLFLTVLLIVLILKWLEII